MKLAKMSTSDLKKLCSTMNVNHIGQGWGPIVALLKRRLQRHRYFHLHSLCYNHHPLQRVRRWPRLQHRHRHRHHHRLQRVLLLLQLPLWRLLLQRGSNSASAATAALFNGFCCCCCCPAAGTPGAAPAMAAASADHWMPLPFALFNTASERPAPCLFTSLCQHLPNSYVWTANSVLKSLCCLILMSCRPLCCFNQTPNSSP